MQTREATHAHDEELGSDDFFANDFLAEPGDEEEVGANLDRTGISYLSGAQRLKRRALGWLFP